MNFGDSSQFSEMSAGERLMHRSEGDQNCRFAADDHRRHWRKGRVAKIEGGTFIADMEDGDQVTVTVPLCISDPEELTQLGRKELRCMDWHAMTEEIMTGKICGAPSDLSLIHI